jgi:hypothetical protein
MTRNAALPYLDEHATAITAEVDDLWPTLVETIGAEARHGAECFDDDQRRVQSKQFGPTRSNRYDRRV